MEIVTSIRDRQCRHPERSRWMATVWQGPGHGSTPLTMTFRVSDEALADLLGQPLPILCVSIETACMDVRKPQNKKKIEIVNAIAY
jgi:hypothetical protein